MRVLLAISVLAFITLLSTCIAIARHIARVRRNRQPIVPAAPPRNLANQP